MHARSARGDRLLRLAAVYYCALGLVVFILDLMSGFVRLQSWGDVPLWYGLPMAPLFGIGLVLTLMAVLSAPSTVFRRIGAIALALLFAAGTFFSGVLAYDYLHDRLP